MRVIMCVHKNILTTCHRRAHGEHRNPMAEATGEDCSGEGSGSGLGDGGTAGGQRELPQKRSRGQPASGGRTQPRKSLESNKGENKFKAGSHTGMPPEGGQPPLALGKPTMEACHTSQVCGLDGWVLRASELELWRKGFPSG